MIDALRQQFSSSMTAEEKTNRLTEFLQIAILKILSDGGYFKHLAFVGGTALRILYDLRRFSEDLDFSLTSRRGYAFKALPGHLERNLRLFGLQVELKPKEEKVVQSVFVKFPGLLNDLGIAGSPGQKLSIRVEVDTNPPRGAVTETSLVYKTYLFDVVRYDLPSLYATKLHACFFRKYTKGRDYYDLVWYLGKRVEPNFKLLNNAIKQTEQKNLNIDRATLPQFIVERLKRVDFSAVRRDVERFLEDKAELRMLDFERLKQLIEGR
ncbi:MAG: nucleotidyl transferase AbiEii/AbiGii toxin family protein [Bacteroidota bacterium]